MMGNKDYLLGAGPVLDRFLKLKTDLFLDKKLKNRSIKLCISQYFAIYGLTLSPVKIVHT